MKKKLQEWFWRYAPSEVLAILLAVIVGSVTMKLTGGNYLYAGIAITVADNIGYYGLLLFREIKKTKENFKEYTSKLFYKDVRNIFVECGPSEVLQTFVVYPLFLSYIPQVFSNYMIGVVVGTVIANVLYYTPTIFMYEWRKKNLK